MRSAVFALLYAASTAIAAPSHTRRSDFSYVLKESHPVPSQWTQLHRAPADQTLQLRIGLKQNSFAELERHLFEVSDPNHERYGKHLSNAEIAALVAPSRDALSSVHAWLGAYGVDGSAITYSAAKDWLVVSLPLSDAETLLDTEYHVYENQDGERIVRTPKYSLPASLHEHIDVVQPTNYFGNPRALRRPFRLSAVQPEGSPFAEDIVEIEAAASADHLGKEEANEVLDPYYRKAHGSPSNPRIDIAGGYAGNKVANGYASSQVHKGYARAEVVGRGTAETDSNRGYASADFVEGHSTHRTERDSGSNRGYASADFDGGYASHKTERDSDSNRGYASADFTTGYASRKSERSTTGHGSHTGYANADFTTGYASHKGYARGYASHKGYANADFSTGYASPEGTNGYASHGNKRTTEAQTAFGGVCNASAVTNECLRTLYGTIDYTPQVPAKNLVGMTAFLHETANISDFHIFLEHQRPDASQDYVYNYTTIAGGTNDQSPVNKKQRKAGLDLEANLDSQTLGGFIYPTELTVYSTGTKPPFKPDQAEKKDQNEPYLVWLDYMLKLENPPHTISTSYGDDEQTVPYSYAKRVCEEMAQLGAKGVSLFFAAGDNGVGENGTCHSNDGKNTRMFIPEFPTSCPYVTSVGATRNFNPEIVAYDNANGYVSGSGVSNYFPRPAYQDAVVASYLKSIGNEYQGLYNTTGRAYPDIAAQGYHYIITWLGKNVGLDGTSCSTPCASSVLALVNDALIAKGKSPLGFLNPALYSRLHTAFTDITIGSTTGCGTAGFSAAPGWDLASGWGTPNFQKLRWLLGV